MLIQHSPDFGGERDRGERLLLEWGSGVEQPALDDVFTGVPRHEEDGQTGIRKSQTLGQFPPPISGITTSEIARSTVPGCSRT